MRAAIARDMRILPLLFLAVAGCATDDMLDTGEVELELHSVWQWTFPTQFNPVQASKYQVGLAPFNGQLHMVHSGSSNPQELWWSKFNGSSWSQNVKLSQTSTGGAALVVHQSQLAMIYRAYGQNRLMKSTSNGIGTFGTPVTIGAGLGSESLQGEPAATVYGGQLYVAYCTNSAVHVDQLVGSSWTQRMRFPFGSNGCEHVEIAEVPGNGLHLLVETHISFGGGSYPIYESLSSDGTNWTGIISTGMQTKQPISVVTCNGITHLTHGGVSDENDIWWSEWDHGAWSPDIEMPNRGSLGGAALGCYGGTRTLEIHPAGGNRLYQSEFGL